MTFLSESYGRNSLPNNFLQILRQRAVDQSEDIAFTFVKSGDGNEIRISYAELDRRARNIAAFLQSKGLAGERALLVYPPGLDYIAGFLGCLYADVIAVPVYPPDPSRLSRSMPRLQSIVQDSRAKIALTTGQILSMIRLLNLQNKISKVPIVGKVIDKVSAGKLKNVEIKDLSSLHWKATDKYDNHLEEQWKQPDITKDTIAYLQYTSGSTGTPRGVILTHENLISNSEMIFQGFGMEPGSEGVIWLPIYHDMGLIGGVLQPLFKGFHCTLMSPIDFLKRPFRWLSLISAIQDVPVVSGGPNFAYDLCIKRSSPEKSASLDLSNWQVAFSGAEPVRADTIEKFSAAFAPAGFKKEAFYPCYGLAEATLIVSGGLNSEAPLYLNVEKGQLEKNRVAKVDRLTENAGRFVGCGKALLHEEIKIVDPETKKQCKPDQVGEIWVAGKSVAKGYWNKPEATKETFQAYITDTNEGPFLRTGDLGFVVDGELYITGRLKDLIIIHGANHYPQDIELTVERSNPMLRHGCGAAFSIEVDGEERLIVVQEVRPKKGVDWGTVVRDIRTAITITHELQAYAIALIKARTIFKTSSGKIRRRATKQALLNDELEIVYRWNLKDQPEAVETVHTESGQAKEDAETLTVPGQNGPGVQVIVDWLVDHLGRALGTEREAIDIQQPFVNFGLDSAQAVGLVGDLEVWLNRTLSPTLIWDYPNIVVLANYLVAGGQLPEPVSRSSIKANSDSEPIAITGYSLRLPGADNPGEFWQLLVNGVDAITEVPPDRWDLEQFYSPEPAPGKMITRWGGFIRDIDKFDPQFFGISPREAEQIDPQQRLLLEVSWEAIEDAGYTLESIAGTQTGVFVGISGNDYSRLQSGDFKRLNPYSGTGNAFSIASNRISYIFDLKGPSFSVDTACSSSLVSVHNALLCLKKGECDIALAGGVNVILTPEVTITFSQAQMMAPDGRCKTFDESADGYVRGEGVGMVVLKRLSDALRDGDRIHAVIRGSAVNQDGRSNGITAPNGITQQAVIRQALADAKLTPDQIGYFEAHGTGTRLGDPIEVEALKNVMIRGRKREQPLLLGSVKTNIGHLESAAGIAGLLKAVMVLEFEQIPKHLHFKKLNHLIRFDEAPIEIVTDSRPWPRNKMPRFVGVSAYGFGGTNAHIILQEAPQQERAVPAVGIPSETPSPVLLPVSAHNSETLKKMAEAYLKLMQDEKFDTPENWIDFIYSASVRRTHHDYRLACVGKNRREIQEVLQAFLNDEKGANFAQGIKETNPESGLSFVYSGQGPQWYAMGRQLFETEPVYREVIETCDRMLSEYTDWSLVEELMAGEENSRLADTEIAQPAIFALQVALTELWESWGIVPAAVIGHSVGEVAAAYVSGTVSLEDGIRIIYHRSRLMQKATGFGKMAAVGLTVDEAHKAIEGLEEKLSVAAYNGPKATAISGDADALQTVVEALEKKDVFVRVMRVNYAFHSPNMDPFKQELAECLSGIRINRPTIPIYSTVTGKLSSDNDYDPVYWGNNIREPVQFYPAAEAMMKDGFTTFLEISPHPVLSGYISASFSHLQKQGTVVSSLRRKEDEQLLMKIALAVLYAKGLKVNWQHLLPVRGKFISLPTYPWVKERYWFDPLDKGPGNAPLYRKPVADFAGGHPLLGNGKKSPLNPGKRFWQTKLETERLVYLNDHQIQGSLVFPAAAYLEMALSAAKSTIKGDVISLKDVSFFRALFLSATDQPEIEFVLSPYTHSTAFYQIFSRTGNDGTESNSTWHLHSAGTMQQIAPGGNGRKNETVSLNQCKNRCIENVELDDFFDELAQRGLQYGPSFRCLQELKRGDNEALGRVSLLESLLPEKDDYVIHPALLDGCFQVLSASLSAEQIAGDKSTYMPVGVEKITFYKKIETQLWSHAQLHNWDEKDQDELLGNIRIFADDGELVAEVAGLRLQRLGSKKEEDLKDWIYRINWSEAKTQPKEISRIADAEKGSWLIFRTEDKTGEDLRNRLTGLGENVVEVRIGTEFHQSGDRTFYIDPSRNEDYEKLLQLFKHTEIPPLKGVVYLWSLAFDAEDQLDLTGLENAQKTEVVSALYLTQSVLLAGFHKYPGIFLVTQGAVPVDEKIPISSPLHSSLWGLGKVISVENPGLNCKKIDMEKNDEENAAELLLQELFLADRENEIAYRRGKRLVARLERDRELLQTEDHSGAQDTVKQLTIPGQQFKLTTSNSGVLDGLQYVPAPRIEPGANQVEIEVVSTGLNFRDVLMALGLYPGGPIPLGSECAGVVTRVGDHVTELKPGDEVIAVAPDTFSGYAVTLAGLVVKKPASLGFAEAATIPITYLTAYYGLHYLGRLRRGERILIHAGAGGVGQAAIQIAQMIGAEIFSTAGSDEKRNFLGSIGVQHIMNSRSLDFADEIMEITKGEGIDVVLNSLAGEFIPRSLTLLRPYGRFLEIGKTDIYQNSQIDMFPFRNNLSYFAIDLDMISRDKPELIHELFTGLMNHFETGKLRPLPMKVFTAPDVIGAFRYMAQRRNIGKIVVAMKESVNRAPVDTVKSRFIKENATYLLTGGLGSLGLILSEWLVGNGAKNIVLLGRTSANETAKKKIDALIKQGARVEVMYGDVADEQRLKTVLSDIADSMPPLKGIIHAAGILDDHAFAKLPADSLQKVMRPKMLGSWNLHKLTLEHSLDFFILFSSVASVVGNPGQANYSAANQFMDALAWYRHKLSLPALSINWGYWSRLGMAAQELEEGERLMIKGAGKIPVEKGLQILNQLIGKDVAQVVVTPVSWPELLEPYPGDKIPPLYLQFADQKIEKQTGGETRKADITRQQLLALNAEERRELIASYLQDQLARVIGISAEKLETDKPLNSMGLDSLMAIELKNSVESGLPAVLPIALLLKGPAILEIADELISQIVEADENEDEKDFADFDVNGKYIPVSEGQKAMWFQHQLSPASIFNQVYAVRIPSEIDIAVLHKAIASLVARHPSLRTNFSYRDGRPVQVIQDEIVPILQEMDVSNLTEEQIKQKMAEDIARPFDLEHEPLTRLIVYSKAKDDHLFLFVGHHIISDMWSLAIFMYELNQYYSAGGYTKLPEVGFSYAEFVRRQRKMIAGREGENHWQYWREKLKGDLPILDFPTDKLRPAVQSYTGKSISLTIGRELSNKLKLLSENYGTTLYTTLLTAFVALLNRYTGQEDIIIGSPTTGRTRPEYAPVLGYFVNPVAVRSQVSGYESFTELLQQVKQTVVEALSHQDYPFNLIVEKLQPRRDPSRTPIFQHMFVYQKAYLLHESGMSGMAVAEDGGTMKLGDITLESVAIEDRLVPFDLTMLMAELDDGLGASLQYNTDLFYDETMERFLRHFYNFIAAIAENPDRPISAYQILTDAEMENLILNWNQTRQKYKDKVCVQELFEIQVNKNPAKPALVFNNHVLSYRELNEKVNNLAWLLKKEGVGPDKIVGISTERSLEMVIGILAILKAGGAYLPIDPTYPKDRLSYMFKDSNIRLLLTQQHLIAKLPENSVDRLYFEQIAEDISLARQNPSCEVDGKHLAYIIYTSGSTGKPKGVMVTQSGLRNLASAQIKDFDIKPETRLLQFASFSFDAAASEIFTSLIAGATLYLVENEVLLSGPGLTRFMQHNKISATTFPPSVLRVLPTDNLDALRTVVSAGEVCTTDVAERWSEKRNFINAYGPTEATVCATSFHVNGGYNHRNIPIGKPIDNVLVYVLDPFLNPVPVGVPGELYIGGAGIARGYLDKPDLTAEKFIPDLFAKEGGTRLYKTGDLVRYLPDGNIEFLDRIDQQVKLRGFRIELGEIEAVLKSLEAVEGAVAVAVEDRIVAYVHLQNPDDLDVESLKFELRRKLPEYMVPSSFIKMDKFPLTANGKIDYKELPSPQLQSVKLVEAETEIERKLVKIWQEILHQRQIGIHDNFFDLGGHSLAIIQAQGKIKETFDREIDVVDMFKYPTINTFAKYLGDGSNGEEKAKKSQDRASRQREAMLQQRRSMNRRKR